jgi:hypothetical protein
MHSVKVDNSNQELPPRVAKIQSRVSKNSMARFAKAKKLGLPRQN